MLGYVILAAVLTFLAVLIIRTLRFTPKPQPEVTGDAVEFDREASLEALRQLVQCKTVSYNDKALEDEGEFQKLIGLLPRLYPHVFKACEFQQLPDRGLLFRWPGKGPGDPAILMAHYDVVPVDESKWEKPPFDAILEDGVLWGRGTLDTKVTFNGVLSGANTLISRGFRPQQDVYFAFSGGEEVNGNGARNIVDWFREKGMMNVAFKTQSAGGHASAPKPHTPVGVLSAACKRIEDHPFPAHIQGPAAMMFDTLGRYSTALYRVIFANLWCFGWVLDLLGKTSGGEMNALMRTTVAFTQMRGSSARNVIPPEASMVANMRLNPADSVASARAYLEKVIGNPAVEVSILECNEPSPVSRTDCPGWEKVSSAVANTWPGCVVAPYLMVQCSDSRHYGPISDKVYRFSAMDLTAQERSTIHGNNEKIRVETAAKAVEFYIRLMKQC